MNNDDLVKAWFAKAFSDLRSAVTIRYPDDLRMPSREEAQSAFAIARKIKELVLQKVNPGTQGTGGGA